MIEIKDPEINVDEIMEKIRKEVARRHSKLVEPAKPSPAGDAPETESPEPVLLPRLNSHPQLEIKADGYHVNDFLRFHDRAFVTNAYKGLLKRAPDNEGLSHNLDRLRRGTYSKIEILGRLRYSPEGKTKNVRVKGLLFPLGMAQAYKLPVLGYLVRLATAMIRLPTLVKNHAQYQQHMMGVHEQVQEYLNNVAGSVEDGFAKHVEKLFELEESKADRSTLMLQDKTIKTMEGGLSTLRASVEELENRKVDRSGIIFLAGAVGTFEGRLSEVRTAIEELKSSKAKQSEITSLNETVRSLEGGLGEMQAAVEVLERSKANLSEVTSLGEVIETMEARLDQLLDTIEQLEGRKAEQSQVMSNGEAIKTLRDTLSELQAAMNELNASKAEGETVVSLGERLSVFQENLSDLRSSITDIEGRKAESKDVFSQRETLVGIQGKLAELNSMRADLESRKAEVADLAAGTKQLEAFLNQRLSEYAEHIATVQEHLDKGTSELERINDQKANKDELITLGDHKADKDETAQIRVDITDMLHQLRDHKLNILDQQRRVTLLLEEARKRLPEPISTEQIQNMVKEEDHMFDAMYVSFAEQFRGTREDIKHTQKIYLPYIQKAGAGTKDAPILDVGCGRGEWLELCKENELLAKGIDINRVLVSQCLESGFDVDEGDALTYFKAQKDASFGLVTGFHIIEHLPLNSIVAFFDEVFRILKSQGLLILETPNPDNLIVASRNFYMDPTHLRPLPSPLLTFIAEDRGFINIEILKLHPYVEYDQNKYQDKLSELINGPQDYALIGYKA